MGELGSSLPVRNSPFVSTVNSSTALLGPGAEFVGAAEEVYKYAEVVVFVYTDQNSATDGLIVEWSTDGITWMDSDTFTITPSGTKTFTFGVSARFFRVRYMNGGVAQTAFSLQTILRSFRGKPSSHRIKDSITDQNDAELVLSAITGLDPIGGVFRGAEVTEDGRLKVDAQSSSASATLNDKYYGVESGIQNIVTGAAEVSFLYLSNPINSGKNLKVDRILYSSLDNVNVIFRRYYNPTGVANGTALTVHNLFIGSATASAMLSIRQPTQTTLGTNFHTTFTIGAVESTALAGSLVIKPGNSILITVETAANNKRVSCNVSWIEEL